MDYEKAAAQIRNGPGDLALVTTVLAELLDDLVSDKPLDVYAPTSDNPVPNDLELTD